MCADPSAPGRGDQANPRVCGRASGACLALLVLVACGPSLNPLEWARVAAGRAPTADLPPVPGADRPYPNLGAVPQRPVPPSPEQRRRIADALVADRENARHVGPPAMPAPVGVPPPAAPSPSPLTAQPATPLGALDGGADVTGMVAPLAAPPASPPPPIAGAPRPAGPAPPPGQSPPPFQPAPAPQAAVPAPAAAPPVAPASAPPPPRSDPSVIVDRTALPPPRPAPAVTLPAGQGAALAFPPGSATLPAEARAVVARFAAGLGGAAVRVTGYRDSAGGDLALALARAQAVAQALRAAGLPAEAIELAAEPRPGPAGRGAEMRLVYSP
jgi:outer membrane protein OmpA-like peptidoglycan-associated protein